MITLFILNGKIWYVLILFGILGLYALGNYMLSRHNSLFLYICSMTDSELITRFNFLLEDYDKQATYWKGQELALIFDERKKRKLLQRLSDEDIINYYQHLRADHEHAPTYWKKKELTYVHQEVEKRHLL